MSVERVLLGKPHFYEHYLVKGTDTVSAPESKSIWFKAFYYQATNTFDLRIQYNLLSGLDQTYLSYFVALCERDIYD